MALSESISVEWFLELKFTGFMMLLTTISCILFNIHYEIA
jgi:hypothetical protein